MFEAKLKQTYKTCVKHTILDLGHALLTHHEAPRIHKPHECHLEGSWDHLGASCGPSGSHLEAIWGPSWGHLGNLGAIWTSCGKLKKAYKTCVKHTILYLGHALVTHHEAPRIHKPHECHLECSW